MRKFSLDTDCDAEKVQFDLLKHATCSERLQKTFEMSSWMLWLSKQAIAKAHPTWDQKKVSVYFVEIYYGKTLAEQFQNYLGNL